MVYIENPNEFIQEVSKIFNATQKKDSIWITFKKYTPTVPKKESQNGQKSGAAKQKEKKRKVQSNDTNLPPEGKEGCLVRATNGDDIKVYTIVSSKDLVNFQTSLSGVMKEKMTALKKGNEKIGTTQSDLSKKRKKTQKNQ